MSLADAECLIDQPNLVVISILEGAALPADLMMPEERVLRLTFHDVNPAIERYLDGLELFDLQHARQINSWIRQWQEQPEAFDFVCHCRGGISRSAAVATYIADSTGCAFPRRSDAGEANQHVLRILRGKR